MPGHPVVLDQQSMTRQAKTGDGALSFPVITTVALDSNQVITAEMITFGIYVRTSLTLPRTDTTDTAAAILLRNQHLIINESIFFIVSNTGAQILTIAGGTGVTAVGNLTTASGMHLFLLTKTSETAMTLTGL